MSDIIPANADFQSRLKAKVQDLILSEIPDEQITKMVQDEIQAFFHGSGKEIKVSQRVEKNSWSGNVTDYTLHGVSPFQYIVYVECLKHVEATLVKLFAAEEFSSSLQKVWKQDEAGMHEVVDGKLHETHEALLKDMAMSMAAAMFREMFKTAVIESRSAAISTIMERIRT